MEEVTLMSLHQAIINLYDQMNKNQFQLVQMINDFRQELRTEIKNSAEQTKTELRAEIKASAEQTKEELRAEMKEMKEELRTEMKQMKTEIISEVSDEIQGTLALIEKNEKEKFQNHETRILRLERAVKGKNGMLSVRESDGEQYDAD